MKIFMLLLLQTTLTLTAATRKKCVHNGVRYDPGWQFQMQCNTCTCIRQGIVMCTMMGCGAEGDCEHESKSYWVGECFKEERGGRFYFCTCQKSGKVRCSRRSRSCSRDVVRMNKRWVGPGGLFFT